MKDALREFRNALDPRTSRTASKVPRHMDLHPGNIIIELDKSQKFKNLILIDYDYASYKQLDALPSIRKNISLMQRYRYNVMPNIFLSKIAIDWASSLIGKTETALLIGSIFANSVKETFSASFDEANMYFVCSVLSSLLLRRKGSSLTCEFREKTKSQ